MATKLQIFKILAACQVPVSREFIADRVGESYRNFQTQLDRWKKQGVIEEKHRLYLLTQAGELELKELEHPKVNQEPSPELKLKIADKVIQYQEEMAKATSFRIVIIEDDLNRLTEPEFKKVWGILAILIRSRGRKTGEES